MTEVRFPSMSDDADATGVVVTWFVDDGQEVVEGALIAEVAMDKVDQELPAPASGVISLLVAEEQAVPQGSVIATIGG
ncbi:lipoyl domain-containing protein [Microbacterium sp. NPDC064584]|uniref:lipoyl domain-containing protein n=1 Tax=Microbacterium TaxID=33882 RepID=UPI0034235F4D